MKPVYPLAGGNFFYVTSNLGDRKGHNVNGIADIDLKFRGYPPGYNRAADPSIVGYNPGKPLTCAGSNGCHGNRNIEDPFESIFGAHHAIDKPIDGSTIARSYRYLRNTNGVKGVIGLEDDQWNQKSTASKHNEYTTSINAFCSSCHGDFHSTEKTGKPNLWFRHPTGVSLPDIGEYIKYSTYNVDAPIARQILPQTPSSEVTAGKDAVTCLSCHVSHSSAYASMLRWDYDNIYTAEEGKVGCLICHTEK
jgi:hypothetical protein